MDIRIPDVNEGVFSALVAKWFKENGAVVEKDEPLCQIETTKIALDITADATGVLSITIPEGGVVDVGTVIGTIDEQTATDQPLADV